MSRVTKMMTNRMENSTQLLLARPKIPVKRTIISKELMTVPARIQGLNLPHLVWVLSTTFPINGSMAISATLTTTIKVVIR